MDDPDTAPPPKKRRDYPLGLFLLVVLLWVLGFLAFVLFGFFALITLNAAGWPVGLWNLAMAVALAYAVLRSIRIYVVGTAPRSTLLLSALMAAIGAPVFASGGCLLLAGGLRIAG